MTKPEPIPSASFEPQGTCPNAWVARIDGIELRTSAGGIRRFGSEAAAIKKARNVIAARLEREGKQT